MTTTMQASLRPLWVCTHTYLAFSTYDMRSKCMISVHIYQTNKSLRSSTWLYDKLTGNIAALLHTHTVPRSQRFIRLKRPPASMHQITTLVFRYVSRSRTSCVGHHLTDHASSMMPHQKVCLEMGDSGGGGGGESGSGSKKTAYRIN